MWIRQRRNSMTMGNLSTLIVQQCPDIYQQDRLWTPHCHLGSNAQLSKAELMLLGLLGSSNRARTEAMARRCQLWDNTSQQDMESSQAPVGFGH